MNIGNIKLHDATIFCSHEYGGEGDLNNDVLPYIRNFVEHR